MKKAIVIGATSGIGRGLTELLVEKGYRIGITGRREELLDNIKNQHHEQIEIKQFDLTDTANVAKNLDELTLQLGGNIDLIIISSGTGDINTDLNFEIEKRTIDVNVSGFTAAADWAFNSLQRQKHGHLAAITSVAGIRGAAESPAYNATKSYQTNYLEALSVKASKLKLPITVTDIRPGFVDTDMAKGEGLFWIAPVDKACKQILNAISHKKRIVYITKRWSIISLLLKLLPYWIYKRLM